MFGWTLILIIISHVLDLAATWDYRNALILTGPVLTFSPELPTVVRPSTRNTLYIVYYPEGLATIPSTFAFCFSPTGNSDLFCNHAAQAATNVDLRQLLIIRNYTCPIGPYYKLDATGPRNNCTHNGRNGYKYTMEYRLCLRNQQISRYQFMRRSIVVSKLCYDPIRLHVILGSYIIETPNLLTNPYLEDERTYDFPLDDYDFYPDIYNNWFSNLLRPSYENIALTYVQRSVLPPEWLPFGHQRRPLYHYTNLAPMDIRFVDNWEAFLETLRTRIARMHTPVHVTAGTLGRVWPHGTNSSVWNIFIPHYWWILIQNSNKSHGVVVMLNNTDATEFNHRRPFCSRVVCRDANILPFLPRDRFQNISCCWPASVASDFNIRSSRLLLGIP